MTDKKVKQKNKDIIIFHTIKPFGHKLIVSFVNKNITRFSEILNIKSNKIYSDWLKNEIGSFDLDDDSNGTILFKSSSKYPVCLLLLNNPTISSLRHEVFHLTDLLAKYYCFENELEFKAYLFNDLYGDIIKIYDRSNKKIRGNKK